jgi:hypothetical protein
MDWLHCNCCFKTPAQAKASFFITSCGHVVCSKCAKKNLHTTTPTTADICRACKKKATLTEVNRTLPKEQQIFFRDPKDLQTEYAANMKKVVEFQSYHRSRLAKHRETQVTLENLYYCRFSDGQSFQDD